MKKVVLRSKQKAIEAEKTKKPIEYKHGAILHFKGIVWRHNKTYGEWRTIKSKELRPKVYAPSIDSTTFPRPGWRVSGAWGKTPLEALTLWAKANLEMHQRDLKGLQERVKEEKIAIRVLRSKNWA